MSDQYRKDKVKTLKILYLDHFNVLLFCMYKPIVNLLMFRIYL